MYSHYGYQCGRKMEIDQPHDPAIPLLGMPPKDASDNHREIYSTMSIDALFITAKEYNRLCPVFLYLILMKTINCLTNRDISYHI